jgi:hypothetical protein
MQALSKANGWCGLKMSTGLDALTVQLRISYTSLLCVACMLTAKWYFNRIERGCISKP